MFIKDLVSFPFVFSFITVALSSINTPYDYCPYPEGQQAQR